MERLSMGSIWGDVIRVVNQLIEERNEAQAALEAALRSKQPASGCSWPLCDCTDECKDDPTRGDDHDDIEQGSAVDIALSSLERIAQDPERFVLDRVTAAQAILEYDLAYHLNR